MKPNTSKVTKGLYFIVALTTLILITLGSAKAQISTDPNSVIYGVSSTGKIYPISIDGAKIGAALNLNPTTSIPAPERPSNLPNGIGYSNVDSKFYYFWKSPNSGATGVFTSYHPTTRAYETLPSVGGPTQLIKSGSVNMDGRYFCLDVLGQIFSYSNTERKWNLTANKIIDKNGNDISAVISVYNTGDMAFDGLGNLWIVVSGKPSGNIVTPPMIGLFKLSGPFNKSSPSTYLAESIIPTDQVTPDGTPVLGIAFNPMGDIFISTMKNLYLFDPETKSFSPKGTISDIQDLTSTSYPMNVMPVTWVSFNTEVGAKNQVLLTWEVTDQVDNKGFYVQYSRDQKKWEDITFIDSKSTGGKNEKYSYIFTGMLASENYFRIKQVDLDGKFSYSQVRNIRSSTNTASSESNVVIYPNPVRDVMNITNLESSNYTARIVDMGGRVIKSFVMRNGQNQVDVADLKSGIYFISMNDMNGKINTAKMVKL